MKTTGRSAKRKAQQIKNAAVMADLVNRNVHWLNSKKLTGRTPSMQHFGIPKIEIRIQS
jgi:hypothetical protein